MCRNAYSPKTSKMLRAYKECETIDIYTLTDPILSDMHGRLTSQTGTRSVPMKRPVGTTLRNARLECLQGLHHINREECRVNMIVDA